MSIAENIAAIRRQMDAAALAAGRDPKSILLCAATKMNDSDAVRQAIAAGVGLSLFIELLQLPFFDRVSDIDDLILNSVGFLTGYGIFLLIKSVKKSRS